MQDRFKFRVWDTLANKMTYNFMLGNFIQKSQTDYEKKDWVGINYEPDYICFNNEGIDYLVLMQPTGLRDKNGKLIYEGDVVYKKGSKNWKNEKLLSKVIWSSNSAAFMISDENGLHQMPMNSNNIEILGNIYETPELIGGE